MPIAHNLRLDRDPLSSYCGTLFRRGNLPGGAHDLKDTLCDHLIMVEGITVLPRSPIGSWSSKWPHPLFCIMPRDAAKR